MPKTVYTAIDANGVEHTRKTDRTYTHTVVFQRSKDSAITRANEDVAHNTKHAREQFHHAAATIEENKGFLRAKRCDILCRDDVYATKMQTEGKGFVAKYGTPEGYAAAKLAEALAAIEATDWTVWHNAGWCGRHDLALKLAAQSGPSAVILPATAK
ncbi:hypothetical protein [Mesorhizobium argentiipisi]|uniref:Uncharacterized protein n=1 Tax=Mesorhizobium argentiipisi TaxID=3015175 RepID=A0ABU8KB42_9HYPH